MITQECRDDKIIYWQVAAFIAVVLGIYARFIGLNTWSLAVDEYFIVKSTDYILDKGIPQYQCGGYYVRGLLMQYIIAAERFLGVPTHLAPRLVSATSFFISLPAIFLLCRRLSGNILAYAGIILFSLSAWEIEFARFGRMYALFQSVFLWYLVFLVRAIVDNCRTSRYSMYLLTIIAPFLWEGAVFLALLNFLPARLDYKKIKWQDWLISGVIFISVYIFLTTNFRFWDQINPMPLNLKGDLVETEKLSNFNSTNNINPTIWYLLALIPLGLSVWCTINIVKTQSLHWVIKGYLFSIVILSLSHLFGVIVYLTLLFLLYDPVNFIKTITSKWKVILTISLSSLILWSIYFSISAEFLHILTSESKAIFLLKLIKALFGFPNIFNSFIFIWLPVMPVFLAIFILSFFIFIYSMIKNKNYNSNFEIRFITILVISLIYIVGLLDTLYNQTRYLFFIYPVLLILSVYFINSAVSYSRLKNNLNISFAISILIIFLACKDWNTNHIFHVDDYDINFRTIYNNQFSRHYYPRRDKVEPAEFINKNKSKNDIIVITELPFEYYLNTIDYVYRNHKHKEFGAISCQQGKLERWTNAPLIYKEKDLYRLIENTKGYVWLVLLERRKDPDQLSIRKKYEKSIIHRSPDKEYIIFKIPGGKLF